MVFFFSFYEQTTDAKRFMSKGYNNKHTTMSKDGPKPEEVHVMMREMFSFKLRFHIIVL